MQLFQNCGLIQMRDSSLKFSASPEEINFSQKKCQKMLKGSPQNAVNLLNFKNMQVMIGSFVRKVAKKGISEIGSR